MGRAPQKRRIETRQRLLDAAGDIVAEAGFAGLRVDEVVARAGVAKGTFFAHFPDKDRLLAELIGARMQAALADIAAGPPPDDVEALADRLAPLYAIMASERAVFDIVVRYSGAALETEPTEITRNFVAQDELLTGWIARLQARGLRRDVPARLLAEGVQAFATQAIALHFCVLHDPVPIDDRIRPYLRAWLTRDVALS
ncbi:TetR/AcrR family transcriptional regulator [Roseicyclus persicicus]|uniref:TetR/AcrR family transcriptional regulator n=1 Tax=Roseicyclus persicicus TaxID=2650661 RepID=A0A7X6GZ14_9RHOB|nr:TetR/AcrR family transcriptional regulator [Roseibacterium persicicum]NKX45017.1 TetR/AcrR family transcriptional regulator [Roseibacterium persicicum]